MGLEPIESLLEALGHPERGFSVIHIAGSKGKGSTALLVESVLRGCGRRVGTFTSPHLERWTERFRVDGREVAGERLVAAVNRVRPHVEDLRQRAKHIPSFFDATTAVAWCLFEEAQVEHVVLEVGLGGRLDSTNAVVPVVTCITSIELEHTDKLGDTLAAIATEKAGILKPGVPAVVGPLPSEAMEVVERKAHALGAPLSRLGSEIELRVRGDGTEAVRELRVRDGELRIEARLPLLGSHQAANAALAIACAKRALKGEVATQVLAAAAASALASTNLPGRIEVLREAPRVLIDSAHTEASAKSLAQVLEAQVGRVHLVLSISADKDVAVLLDVLLPHAAHVTVTRADRHRSMDAQALADLVCSCTGAPVDAEPEPEVALRTAYAALRENDVLCVAGSFYLAGIARRVLGD